MKQLAYQLGGLRQGQWLEVVLLVMLLAEVVLEVRIQRLSDHGLVEVDLTLVAREVLRQRVEENQALVQLQLVEEEGSQVEERRTFCC